ncbi:MAG TPA: patatin-like phospholipase family protein [Lentimicrobium sp.]|nr:patatin-like phospholipase family protein [Lentimicrobium sp.]
MIKRLNTIVILVLFTCFSSGQAVGLVLSGGGSKGVSHIGVIRALEEAEIPIDYITGTSMGAIIGGLYAAGYSPDEMEALITSSDFEYWSTGKTDPKYKFYFKEPPSTAAWIDLRFDVDSVIKPLIPTNLISPVMMDFTFLELFASASAAANYDFDKLMVPFRCMASDISKAQPVVMQKGDLGSAIRASMTFPFYFKPIRIDSVLLFDGGMYNNFPSDIMVSHFNPDIIIGSQASSNAEEPEVNDIMSQIENMLMQKSNFNVICDNGVMIKPNVLDVNVIDFSHTHAFIDSGYIQAKRMIPEIRQFVVERRTKHQLDSLRNAFNLLKPELTIGSVEIKGLRKNQFQYMDQLLSREAFGFPVNKSGGNKLSLQMIKPQYYKFVAEGKVGDIYPKLDFVEDAGNFHLTIEIERQNQLVTELGGAITSSSVNELFLQLKYFLWSRQAVQLRANSYFGRFYNSALIEARMDVPKLKPYYFTGGFVFNKCNYFNTNTFFYANEDPFFLIEQERFGYISLGFPYKNKGKFLMDLSLGSNVDKYYQTNTYTSIDKIDRTKFVFASPGLNFEINTLNYKEYPNSGSRLFLKAYLISGTETYYPGTTSPDQKILEIPHTWILANAEYENYFATFKKFRFGLYAQINYSSQSYFSNYTASVLSSSPFQPIPESVTRFFPVYRANKFAAFGLKNIYKIGKNLDFRLEGYLFMAKDVLRKDPFTSDIISSPQLQFNPMASTTMVYRTPIGPISMDVNYYNISDQPVSFFLKFGYLIFNRRPF